MVLRPASMSLVCMAPGPAPVADEATVMSVGGKVRVQGKYSSM